MKLCLVWFLLWTVVACLPAASSDPTNPAKALIIKKAEQVQKRILAFDSHVDLPFDARPCPILRVN
jgi:hypothetical protein